MNRYLFRSGKLLLSLAMMAILIVLGACSSTYAPTTNPAPATSSTPITSLPPSTSTATSPVTSPPTSTPPSPVSSPTPTGSAAAAGFSVNIASNPTLGNLLVDSKGMTLYYFAKDTTGKSNATGAILATWPIFNATTINVPASLNAGDVATITRDDGLKQTTYKGWPLYYYAKDKAPGDVLGENVGGVWFVVKSPFYTVMLQNKADPGNYLADAKGMTLYYFTKDSVGKSTATGAILAAWPLFNAGNFIVPSSINASNFGTITRSDGLKVSTFKGWPLYYFAKDQVSGDTLGQGFGGVWFVINPANFPPTPAGSTAPSPTPSASPATGGTGY